MRLICIGDLHLDCSIGGRDYHDDVRDRLYEIAVRPDDVIVQLGDIVDPDHGARTHRGLATFARWAHDLEWGNVVHALVGNHDAVDDVRCTSALDALYYVEGVVLHSKVEVSPLTPSDYIALWLPWLSPAHGSTDVLALARAAMEQCPLGDREYKFIAFCHLDIPGCTPGSEVDMPRMGRLELPQELVDDPRIERFICGHQHARQDLQGGRIHVVGSLECLGFGERADEKSHTVVEL